MLLYGFRGQFAFRRRSRLECLRDDGQAIHQVGYRPRRSVQHSHQRAGFARHDPPTGGGCFASLTVQRFRLDNESVERVAGLLDFGTERETFTAGTSGLREAHCQLIRFRFITNERRELSPLRFDRSQLFEDVVAFDRFDALAERFAARQSLAASTCRVTRGFDFASMLRHPRASSIGSCGKSSCGRRVSASQRVPGRTHARKVSRYAIGIRNVRQTLDAGTQQRLLLPQLAFSDAMRVFRVFDCLQHRLRAPRHGHLLRPRGDGLEDRDVRARRRPHIHHAIERGQRDVPMLAVQHGGEQFVG